MFSIPAQNAPIASREKHERIPKLLAAVTFFYSEPRLPYFERITSRYSELADKVELVVVTNTAASEVHDAIHKALAGKKLKYDIVYPSLMGHPYLLTWFHLDIFRQRFADESYTHFLYSEDDMELAQNNIRYWLRAREQLRPHGLIPSFLRVEAKHGSDALYLTDCKKQMVYHSLRKLVVNLDYAYLNPRTPYQAVYLLDRELMEEHLNNRDLKPEYSPWGIREIAALGLTLKNIPKGFEARNVFGYDLKNRKVDVDCLIAHLPSNYANDPNSKFGKFGVDKAVKHYF